MAGRPLLTDRVSFLLGMARGQRVLHVGCADAPFTAAKLGDGRLLHARLAGVAGELYGIDASADALDLLLRAGYTNLARVDVQDFDAARLFPGRVFDLVLAGEIIEHLPNPGLFLRNLAPLLRTPSARLVLTTPNAYCAYRFLYTLLTGREGGHEEHTAYYSRRTLQRLLAQEGYRVEDLRFYPANECVEIRRGRGRILLATDRLAGRLRPALADGIMATCSHSG